MSKEKPHIIKAGRGIRAKIWSNQGENGQWFNINLVRTYKNDEGELKDSESFSVNDLLYVTWVAAKAYDYVKSQDKKE